MFSNFKYIFSLLIFFIVVITGYVRIFYRNRKEMMYHGMQKQTLRHPLPARPGGMLAMNSGRQCTISFTGSGRDQQKIIIVIQV